MGDGGVGDLPVKPKISAPLGAPHRLGKGMVANADTGSIETTGTMRQTEREKHIKRETLWFFFSWTYNQFKRKFFSLSFALMHSHISPHTVILRLTLHLSL